MTRKEVMNFTAGPQIEPQSVCESYLWKKKFQYFMVTSSSRNTLKDSSSPQGCLLPVCALSKAMTGGNQVMSKFINMMKVKNDKKERNFVDVWNKGMSSLTPSPELCYQLNLIKRKPEGLGT